MKKTIILAAMIAAAMGASAQWFDFSNNKDRYSLGAHLGVVGIGCNYNGFGGGVSLSAYGVYLDFMYSTPEHEFDNHVTQTYYNDTAATAFNLGYQIPVLPWLRIMPLAGVCYTSAGITDASTVNIEVNENSGTMYHDFDVMSRKFYFNYGCGLFVQPINWLNIYGIYTSHAIYGGVSFNLDALSADEE